MSLNLASRPFVNRRPVQRISLFIWAAGLLLAVVNGFLFWDYLSGQGETESGLQDVVAQLEEESALLQSAQDRLVGLETDELNSKIEFVNLRIQQRTFSWSRLFDVLATTLPDEVRLTSLAPRFEEASQRRRRRGAASSPDEVLLEVRGEAKSSEALLSFLDRLFAHPAFGNPDLHQEAARLDRNVIVFSVSTSFRPDAAEALPAGATSEATSEAKSEAPSEESSE